MKFYAEINLQNKIVPIHDSDYDVLKKIKKNKVLSFEVKQDRNVKFHRLYFSLLNMVFQNQEMYNNIDHLRRDLTIESGYYDLRVNIHGEEVKEPKSISFASMSQEDFSEYYNAVLDTIVKYFQFEKEDIKNNIEQFY